MTLILAIWNKERALIGADSRASDKYDQHTVTDSIQKITIDNKRNIAIASHGAWDFSNGNTIKMVVEDFINNSAYNQSIDLFTREFNKMFNTKYSFMETGFIIIGPFMNKIKCYNLREGLCLDSPDDIGMSFNSDNQKQKEVIFNIYSSVFSELFNRKCDDWEFYSKLKTVDFTNLIEKTILKASVDEEADFNNSIGGKINIAEITFDKASFIN